MNLKQISSTRYLEEKKRVTSSESLYASCALLTSMSVPMSRPEKRKHFEFRMFTRCIERLSMQ
jgi:hypothetical protein